MLGPGPDGGPLLQVRDLQAAFFTRRGVVRAVDGVSLSLRAGETLGLVGESGCGKTVTALSLLRAVPEPGRITAGQVLFEGTDLLRLSEGAMRRIRGRRIAMIPQDPLTALNPVLKVGDHLLEILDLHLGLRGGAAHRRAVDLLRRVGIPLAEARLQAYPHELSGGMRQRVLIAMAIACQPSLLIADEPTTALDATIQAQILELLDELTHALGMALLLITHNLGIVAGHCDRVAVMYAGHIVETAPVEALFARPRHRYTAGLLACVPRLDRTGKGAFQTIPGAPPELLAVPPGCPFHPRCAYALERCRVERPALRPAEPGGPEGPDGPDGPAHAVACWNPQVPEAGPDAASPEALEGAPGGAPLGAPAGGARLPGAAGSASLEEAAGDERAAG